MNILDIIAKKRDGHALTREEINFFISNYVKDEIKDYQAASLLMAIYIRGMNHQETVDLTDAMLHSGDIVNLDDIPGIKVDKHSTGGVGDKTSMVLGPLVACCGAKLAKMSGRGLGHTGGTLDKLESIPGMNISLSDKQFKKQVKEINIALMGQTGNIVPADKKLYALRDVTATVGVIPLIASSIMSKKLASGANTILLDVKMGSGAFMKTLEDAQKLSKVLVNIGKSFKRDTRAVITNMQEPLGLAIGNNLEVIEAINTLHNKGPKDFTLLCKKCAAIMLEQANIVSNEKEAVKLIDQKLNNGEAFNKFLEFVKAQGGDISYIKNPNKFKKAKNIYQVKVATFGYIKEIVALEIGEVAMLLGAGRLRKEDKINPSAGIILNKKVGDKVNKNDVLCTLYTDKKDCVDIIKRVRASFIISKQKVKEPLVIIDYIK